LSSFFSSPRSHPEIDFVTEPAKPEYFYQHSLWMKKGTGWLCVVASGARGLRSAKLSGLQNGRYTVRLIFASPDCSKHRFDIKVQDRVLPGLQPPTIIASTKTLSDIQITDITLNFKFTTHEGETLLGGIEVIRSVRP
jgi:hypothetical protein